MSRRKRYPSRKKMDFSSFRTIACEDLIGRTTRFRDRIQCYECDESDPYEMCPGIGNPGNCPKKGHEAKVQKVSVSRVKKETIYTINDDYEFPTGDFWKVVRIGKAG